MKKEILIIVAVFLCLLWLPALAQPELSGVFADDVALISGQDGWYFDFYATEGGRLGMQLLSGETASCRTAALCLRAATCWRYS